MKGETLMNGDLASFTTYAPWGSISAYAKKDRIFGGYRVTLIREHGAGAVTFHHFPTLAEASRFYEAVYRESLTGAEIDVKAGAFRAAA